MSTREDLVAAKALIDTPEKWFKGNYSSEDGQRLCSIGAVNSVTCGSPNRGWIATTRRQLVIDTLEGHLPRRWKGFDVVEFNDAPRRRHADIMALFDRAIAAAGDA